MELFLVFALGVIAGVVGHATLLALRIRRLLREIPELAAIMKGEADEEKAPAADTRLRLRLERHNDVLYTFRVDDGTFVAQGADLAQLQQHLEQRYPGQAAVVTEGDADVLEWLKTQTKAQTQ